MFRNEKVSLNTDIILYSSLAGIRSLTLRLTTRIGPSGQGNMDAAETFKEFGIPVAI